jgi:hypothetical protein
MHPIPQVKDCGKISVSKRKQRNPHYLQPQVKKKTKKIKKYTRKWRDFHKIPWNNTTYYRSKQSLVAEVKSYESDADYDSESEPERGR